MSDLPVTVVLPSGGSRTAEIPDDVIVKELLPELTTSLDFRSPVRTDVHVLPAWTARLSAGA